PPGSVIRFKELTFWQLQGWKIAAVAALTCVEALLIAFLLVERRKGRTATEGFRKSESRYRDLMENASDIIYTDDLQGNFTSLNSAGEVISGYTREEACKMNIAQVVAPEHLDLARQMTARKLSKSEATTYELDILSKDGKRVTLDVSTRLIYDSD